jgi:hypothetical protein
MVTWMRRCPAVVVSEPDIEAALAHLRSLPFRKPLPEKWDRQHLLKMLKEALGKRPKLGQCISVAPGVFGIVKPFGIDLAQHGDPDDRLQVWLAIRPCGTDPAHITEL